MNRKSGSDINRRLFVAVLIFLAAQLAASFFPAQRLWGINQSGFIDGLWLIYPVLILAAVLVCFRAGRRRGFIENTFEGVTGKLFPYFIGAAAMAAFYFLRVKAFYLGDSMQLMANMAKLESAIKYREIGESLIHAQAFEYFGGRTEADARLGYQAVSILSGVVYLAGLIYYSFRIFSDSIMRAAFMILNLLAPTTLLYFGYIENYTVTYLFIALMCFAALNSLQRGGKSIMPVVFFLIAVFMHSLSLILAPAVLIYLSFAYGGKNLSGWLRGNKRKILITTTILFAAVYLGVKLWAPLYWRLALLPLIHDEFTVDGYHIFSQPHLIDFFNLLLFACPVLIAAFILRIKRNIETAGDDLFALVLALCGICAAFIIEPKLGMARDWDLMTLAMSGAVLAGPYLAVSTIMRHSKKIPMALFLVMIPFSLFIPWVAINNSDGALYDYSMQALMRDPLHGKSGMMTMLILNKRKGKDREYRRIEKFLYDNFPDQQMLYKGNAYFQDKNYVEAAKLLEEMIKENPFWAMYRKDLGLTYLELGRYERALECLEVADGLNPYNAEINTLLGKAHDKLGDSEKARVYFAKALKYDRNFSDTYLAIAEMHLGNNDPDSALYYLQQVRKNVPPQSYLLQGRCWLMKGDSAVAEAMFGNYLSRGGDSTEVKKIHNK